MACKIAIRDLVIQEANDQGIPPAIALAVAVKETGLTQWRRDGSVVTGQNPNGTVDVGVMQINSNTAPLLGIDPYDLYDNIRGGVTYLRQMYDKYGDWQIAVQHYNGRGPAAQAYAAKVMAIASTFNAALDVASQCADSFAGATQIAGISLPSLPGFSSNGKLALAGAAIGGAGLVLLALV